MQRQDAQELLSELWSKVSCFLGASALLTTLLFADLAWPQPMLRTPNSLTAGCCGLAEESRLSASRRPVNTRAPGQRPSQPRRLRADIAAPDPVTLNRAEARPGLESHTAFSRLVTLAELLHACEGKSFSGAAQLFGAATHQDLGLPCGRPRGGLCFSCEALAVSGAVRPRACGPGSLGLAGETQH